MPPRPISRTIAYSPTRAPGARPELCADSLTCISITSRRGHAEHGRGRALAVVDAEADGGADGGGADGKGGPHPTALVPTGRDGQFAHCERRLDAADRPELILVIV